MEASRKKQSHVRDQSYVSPERTTPTKVSMMSVAMRARCNRFNNETLDMLKGKIRNRVLFGVQDNLCHTSHQNSSEPLCVLHWWKYGRDNKKSMKKRHLPMCSYCMVHLWIPCFDISHKQITVKEL